VRRCAVAPGCQPGPVGCTRESGTSASRTTPRPARLTHPGYPAPSPAVVDRCPGIAPCEWAVAGSASRPSASQARSSGWSRQAEPLPMWSTAAAAHDHGRGVHEARSAVPSHHGDAESHAEGVCPVSRCPGVLVSWCPGVLVSWCPGVLVSWCPGVLVSWCPGVLVSWCPPSMVRSARSSWSSTAAAPTGAAESAPAGPRRSSPGAPNAMTAFAARPGRTSRRFTR
jgi:hypothetical protein